MVALRCIPNITSDTSRSSIVFTRPVAGALVDLAMLMRNPFARSGKMYALHVRNDNSEGSRAIGRNSLELAVQYRLVKHAYIEAYHHGGKGSGSLSV